MGRSNTLPLEEPRASHSSTKPINRSATTADTSTVAEHSILPHIHLPKFLKHNEPTPPPNEAKPPRPGVPQRMNSVHTRYMNMLLALDTIPRLHNILAAFFTWILLAGFVIFPGTFTSLDSLSDSDAIKNNSAASEIFKSVKNIPLLAIAGACCGIGAGGMLWLWWTWRKNYVWLLNRIFLPGCLNSLAGLISTLINVYTSQEGVWSLTAEITGIVTGSVMAILLVLFIVYNNWILKKVKRSHGRDMARANTGDEDEEGFREKVERVAMEPALEPGSVV